MDIGIGDNKLIAKTTPQDVVWSEVDDPNKWKVQEPYGYFRYDIQLDAWVQNKEDTKGIAFYTAPPKREWVGLTDEEVADYWVAAFNENGLYVQTFASLIEAKLKEKNAESLQKVKNNLQKGKKDETRRGWHRGNRTVSQGHSKERHPTHVKAR